MTDKPDPMELVRDLEKFATNPSERLLAKELGSLLFDHSTLKVENAKLKQDLHHYMLAANAEAQLVDELQKENQQLAEFVVAVGGFWGHTRSKLVGEDSLAECINRGDNDEALLKQALEALERTTPMGFNMESDKKFYAAINALRERLNHTKGS
jgi:regulator of replication initiation timing